MARSSILATAVFLLFGALSPTANGDPCRSALLPVRPSVQVFVLTDHPAAARFASQTRTPLHLAPHERPGEQMMLYLQRRRAAMSFSGQFVPPGGVIDAYDLAGRAEVPETIAGPVRAYPRGPLDPGFLQSVQEYLAEVGPAALSTDRNAVLAGLDRRIREHVTTADPIGYARHIQDNALRELLEETGIRRDHLDFQIGIAQSESVATNGQRTGMNRYSLEQWACVLDGNGPAPHTASPDEADADAYFSVYGAIHAELESPGQFAPRVWEVLVEMALIKRELGDPTAAAYQRASDRRRYYRGLIQNFGEDERSFGDLLTEFRAANPGSRDVLLFLDFVHWHLHQEARRLKGLGPGGTGFALLPLGDRVIADLAAELRDALPEICVTSNFMEPGVPRKHVMKDFPTHAIAGNESYLPALQALGRRIEADLNELSPMAEERGELELYFGEVRRTSSDGPRLPPTVFHYDMGDLLFLNVVVTLEGPLTVVDLMPPRSNLTLVMQDILHGPRLERPGHAHMTEPGFAVVNSTALRVRFFWDLGQTAVGASYHSAPDFPGARMLVNYKFLHRKYRRERPEGSRSRP